MADPAAPAVPIPLPAAKHIFTILAGEQIVSMVRFRDKLLIATNRSVYSAQHDVVTELQFQYEGQAPVPATECLGSRSGKHTVRWGPTLCMHLCVHCGNECPAPK